MKKLGVLLLAVLAIGLVSCEKEDTSGKDLIILGEVMSPWCFEQNGAWVGVTYEVVEKIRSELELTQTPQIGTDWEAMYQRVTSEENIVLFTTALSEERKEEAKWVGPVAIWQYYTDEQDRFNTTHTLMGYFAFSRNVSDKIIRNWQRVVDEMKASGQLKALYIKYQVGFDAPGQIVMFTEPNPPQNFLNDINVLDGSSVEMVKAMMEVMGIDDPILMTNWTDALGQILYLPNSMTFTTIRNTEREPLFKWVGPIAKDSYVFVVKANTDYDISTIDKARSMISIGVVENWAAEDELINLGFTHLVTYSTPQQVILSLLNEDIPCAVFNKSNLKILLMEVGHPPKDVREGATLSTNEQYMAFSIDTDKELLSKWKSAYNQIVSDGKLEEIWNRWYPDIDW